MQDRRSPGFGSFIGIGRPDDSQAGNGPQAGKMFYGLMAFMTLLPAERVAIPLGSGGKEGISLSHPEGSFESILYFLDG